MRVDGRKNNELRNICFTHNFTKHALGSILVEFGETKVIVTASVDLKKPKWMDENDNRGWVTAEYSLLPASTNTRCKREREKVSGRTQEIQRLIGRSLRACVDLEKMPGMTITVDADVIQADGGTRTASICGGYLALKDAFGKLIKSGDLKENPIIEPVAAISIGMLASSITENQIIAGVITIGFFILTWFLPNFSEVFTNFSLINMFSKFPTGQIDIADTVTYVTFTILCLLLTVIVMQRRKSVR